ncbi:MAG: energy-coupling factor ABC transporter ATP-binding protein, partial [Helicobacter sp.]|nr:energy-coupling factor ABC transporter ATP-binding protein [Helicobacter sp.]
MDSSFANFTLYPYYRNDWRAIHINTCIVLHSLNFSYEKGKNLLKNISLQVEEGETLGIIGQNGAGKSTLLKLLVGLESNFSGEAFIAGYALKKENLNFLRQKIGYVFQDSDHQLFMSNVYEDVAFGPRNYKLSNIEERVDKALKQIKIHHLKHKQTYRLSGGEKKLVSIATILSMEPKILLLDEPSVALDSKNRRNLIQILNQLPQTKIITSHDLDFILETCQRVIILAGGEIVANGISKEILKNKELLETYSLE